MTDKDIRLISDEIGLEQILIDAGITHEHVLMYLEEAGFLDLSIYLDRIYEE